MGSSLILRTKPKPKSKLNQKPKLANIGTSYPLTCGVGNELRRELWHKFPKQGKAKKKSLC